MALQKRRSHFSSGDSTLRPLSRFAPTPHPLLNPMLAMLKKHARVQRTLVLGLLALAPATLVAPAGAQRTSLSSVACGGVPGDDQSQDPAITADGRFVAFASNASNLDPRDTNGLRDVFVHDRAMGGTVLVSMTDAGEVGRFLSSNPAISADGSIVVFESPAPNLVSNDTNGAIDVFVHTLPAPVLWCQKPRPAGATRRVSVDSMGFEVSGSSFNPSVSGNGRYVSFDSSSEQLEPLDTNNFQDVFVHDLVSGQTVMISDDRSRNRDGGNERSSRSSLNSDGRFIAFESRASDLVAGDTNGLQDIFVRDRDPDANGIFDEANGFTFRVSVSGSGAQTNENSSFPKISADGRFVVFASEASNLVAGDTNFQPDIFVHDLMDGSTVRASVSENRLSAGTIPVQANFFSTAPDISADGRYVVFESFASTLIPGGPAGQSQIFMRDLEQEITTRLSLTDSCLPGNQSSHTPVISAEGTVVAFQSFANDLVPNDQNARADLFVHEPFLPSPVGVQRIEPDVGSENGGDIARIVGSGFTSAADTTVTLNGVVAPIIDVTSNTIRITTPPGTGMAEVVVSNSNGCEVLGRRYAYVDPFFSSRFGHVNESVGSREDVLLVNSRAGNLQREVNLAVGERVQVDLNSPTLTPNARFVIYAWTGAPSRPSLTPVPFNLGQMVFPAPFSAGVQQPVAIWNNLGRRSQLGRSSFDGPLPTAPVTLVSRRANAVATVTFQGLIEDTGSRQSPQFGGVRPVSITNAVIVKIR